MSSCARIVACLPAIALLGACYGELPAIPPTPAAPAVAAAAFDTPVDPGRVTLHRLNRAEYDQTVRDLLGTQLRPGQSFPPDEAGFGFDNNADALALSPLMLELYERAAEALVADALREPVWEPLVFELPAVDAEETVGIALPDEGVLMFTPEGRVSHPVEVPLPGTYTFRVRAFAMEATAEPATMRIIEGQTVLATVDVVAPSDAPAVFELELELEAGPALLAVELATSQVLGVGELKTITVVSLGLEGPAGFIAPDPDAPTSRERLLACSPDGPGAPAARDCARINLASFLPRAWRRPASEAEVDDLLALYDLAAAEGLDFEDALAYPLQAALMSPHFLFRVELDPAPAETGRAHPLDDYALASRLSYFVWGSMPDDTLFALAAEGRLQDPEELARQVDRMLDDPRASAMVASFTGQWLYTRAVEEVAPDTWLFPEFDEGLRASMQRETELFFQTFVDEDRSMLELVTATDTFVDDRLAAHYELPPVGEGFQRVFDVGPERGGILRHAGLLSALSYPIRTSPVRRGKWVLEQLLCDAPDPPPPGVEALIDEDDTPATLREKMERHRSDPICASCHLAMDPIGLGLEHYDAVGAWRTQDAGQTIDATGVLPGGERFDGGGELAELLAADPRFPACMAEKLFTYALGRGPMSGDSRHLEPITRAFVDGGHRFRDLVKLVVVSDAFRMRRGEHEEVER